MAFVPAPKDLSKVKTKVALNLTKRQLICFSLGGAVSIPVYLIFKGISGNEVSMMALIIIAFPFFFMGIFQKDGMPPEKYISYVIRQKFQYPKVRVYKTQNMYRELSTGRRDVNVNIEATEKKREKYSRKQKQIQ